ncbi:hypothetical protein BOKEGFJH_00096 [Chlamydia avium]|uniref:Uncharacterized protein n=1 Tax=Chlamydia avium TaxID=1457141 RepID=A0ABN0MT83_9CHLA|nr:hypothetical protein [Chlamydia avium]EPP37825.1 hypothetical protein CP10743SC13_0414 [Chlamydia psittaci 10_743_SC13]EPP38700.1 hypothetical protein CP10881SC42_0503 [Chlamydia avium]VVT42587.1 hypothetical protein BOKEGFJH_00096 [Chlamydia avium]
MIKLTQQFKPYTLIPGSCVPIPGSKFYARVFPTLWQVFSSKHELVGEGRISSSGPLKRFCVFQDLHRGGISVFSEKYKYYLLPSGRKVSSVRGCLPHADQAEPFLSLGVYKHADLHKMRLRRDLKEILPFWWRLAALIPPDSSESFQEIQGGIGNLFHVVHQKILQREKTEIHSSLLSLYLAGFSENFLPRIYDTEYQGILNDCFDVDTQSHVPFSLLHASFCLLRDIFISHDGEVLDILPSLPPEFPCGKLIHLSLEGIGKISLEWRKKTIRKVCLHAQENKDLFLRVSSPLVSCRLRQWKQKKIIFSSRVSLGEIMEIKAGTTYVWDCFLK